MAIIQEGHRLCHFYTEGYALAKCNKCKLEKREKIMKPIMQYDKLKGKRTTKRCPTDRKDMERVKQTYINSKYCQEKLFQFKGKIS